MTSVGPLWIVDADLVCARRHGESTGPILLVPGLTPGRGQPITRRSHWRPLLNDERSRAALCGFNGSVYDDPPWMRDPVVLPVECGGCWAAVRRGGVIVADEWTAQEAWRESVDRGHRRYRPGPGDPCVCLVD